MIDVVCVLFDGSNSNLPEFSRGVYGAEWVDKLYRGFKRNYSGNFNFYCLVDRKYGFREKVKQIYLKDHNLEWGCIMEAFRVDIGENKRFIIGLDTIFTGNIDNILSFNGECGLLTDPYHPKEVCNGVGIFQPELCQEIWEEWTTNQAKWKKKALYDGRLSEMKFLQIYIGDEAARLDRLNPQQIQSYKCHYRLFNPEHKRKAKIVYFHGTPKPHEIEEEELKQHWV